MLSAHRTDVLPAGRHQLSMETSVELRSGLVTGTTRIATTRAWCPASGAVRVLAIDGSGAVLGFSGERTFRAAGRHVPLLAADRIVSWSVALFGDQLDDVDHLEVMHYRPTFRRRLPRRSRMP